MEKNKADFNKVVVVVLGGGQGSRLYPLTRDRAKPAVGFGGKYRLIDFAVSNCLHSKCDKIFILTQFNSFSLNRHIWQTYSRETQQSGFIDVLAAQQTPDSKDWYQGTADAVRQSLKYIARHNPKHVLITSADQIYKLDYQKLLNWHVENNADITIAANYTPPEKLFGLGVTKINKDFTISGFAEKPKDVSEVKDFDLKEIGMDYPGDKSFLASMGIYVFNTEVLMKALDNEDEDFGKNVIPSLAKSNKMVCFPFDGYWEDVGTIKSFFNANMEWSRGEGIAKSFQGEYSLITRSRQLPPTRLESGTIKRSLIADGCHISADSIEDSIIGVRTRVGLQSTIKDSIIMGNDFYDEDAPFTIGNNCVINKAIIDKNVKIGDRVRIENVNNVQEHDHECYTIRSGIVVIPKGAVLPDDMVI